MTASEIFQVVSFQFAVVQTARGMPGAGLSLRLLLKNEIVGEITCFLQFDKRQVWAMRDACARERTDRPDRYATYLAKSRAAHPLNYGDKFLKTLAAADPYANYHRRRTALAIPPEFLTKMHPERMVALSNIAQTREGLLFQFRLNSSEPLALFFADDLVFLLTDCVDQAIWAAEWERDDHRDETAP